MTATASRPAATRALKPRAKEARLLMLAGLLTVAAYVLASLGRTASVPVDLAPFLGFTLGTLAVAHVVTRRLAPRATPVLLPVAAALNGIGYVFIARLDADRAAAQATWTALGVAGFAATLFVVREARLLDRYRWTLALLGLGLLLLPLVPGIGYTVNGARLWVGLGPLSFQPGELAKIALAAFFASYLVEKRDLLARSTWRLGPISLPDPRSAAPILLAWGVSILVMTSQKDLGSSLLFFALFVVMLWIATERAGWLALGAGLFSIGAFSAWSVFEHVQTRVRIWINPWPAAAGEGYQIVQSSYALGTGGLSGTGLSLGSPQQIPAAETDFIFSAIGEELGLLGTTAILVAFLVMIGAGLGIARRAQHPLDKLLAAGLTTIVGVQTFIILGGVTRLVPLTGITLPFVSYGGSSLVANYILLALLIRISNDNGRQAAALQEQL
ncbi:MAG TPA: FtsW/RodA/SpoVE family cell cycle protein [Acidimicrobiales bacterium]|nr:FtsW/RodA/SpoVE family cell cycle protein [Acidimicrobiales bacterium]